MSTPGWTQSDFRGASGVQWAGYFIHDSKYHRVNSLDHPPPIKILCTRKDDPPPQCWSLNLSTWKFKSLPNNKSTMGMSQPKCIQASPHPQPPPPVTRLPALHQSESLYPKQLDPTKRKNPNYSTFQTIIQKSKKGIGSTSKSTKSKSNLWRLQYSPRGYFSKKKKSVHQICSF